VRPRTLRRRLALVGLGAIVAAAFVGGIARADTLDNAYLQTLDHFGVYYVSDAAAIELGHIICSGLDSGQTPHEIVMIGRRSGAYSLGDAEYIVGAAIGAYCDQYGYMIGMSSQVIA
jgi:hypothetical protein